MVSSESSDYLKPSGPNRVGRRQNWALVTLMALISTFGGALNRSYAEEYNPQRCAVTVDKPVNQERVEKIERALLAFGERVLPQLRLRLKDKHLLERIEKAFQLISENANNPGRLCPGERRLPPNNPRGFSYKFNQNRDMAAGANGLFREIELPEDFDPDDTGDLLYLLHEAMHLVADSERRNSMMPEEYRRLWTTQARIICVPDEEAMGIAAELEILDVLMRGSFSEHFRARGRQTRAMLIPVKRQSVAVDYLANGAHYFDAGKILSLRTFVEHNCRMVMDATIR